MAETTVQRNALARVQQALEQDKIPAAKDIQLLEQMQTPELDQILDQIDELKRQRSHQATTQKSTDQLQPQASTVRSSQTNQSFVDQNRSSVGSSGPTPEEKRRLSGREKDYYTFFDKRFGPLVVLIMYFAMADLDKAAFYAPSPSECHEVAPHLARIGPKAEDLIHLPKWAHEAIVTSDSTFTVGMVVAGYLDRIGVLEKILPWMTSWVSRTRSLSEQQTSPSTGTVQPGVNGTGGPDQQFPTLDQLGVTGIGEQFRTDA